MDTEVTETPRVERRILLADADAFYVAVARMVDPEGAGKAKLLVVGGRSNRGVVTSASYEARAYGVRSAMPTATARRLCPNAVFVPVPRKVCVEKSRAVLQILRELAPIVEPASIDEFYLDLTGTEHLFKGEDLAATAWRIRQAILENTGLSVSIGGATSRLIAKLAAKQAKPRTGRKGTGVYIVPPGAELQFMSHLRLSDIPMIGPRFQDRLAAHGLHTVAEALELERDRLDQWFGKRSGRWLHNQIRGVDSTPVAGRSPAKSLSHEETFPEDLTEGEDLEHEVLALAVHAAADLRMKGMRARTVTVKIRYSDFTTRQASETLRISVATDRPILATALTLLQKLSKRRRSPVRLLGVSLSQLVGGSAPADQLSLFAEELDETLESERDRTLSAAIDRITSRYGRSGIIRASQINPVTEH